MTKPPIELSPDIPPWERQAGENSLWYGRFLVFRDMGTGRSLLALYKAELKEKARESKKKQPTAAPGAWYATADQYRWNERAAAWDTHRQQEIEAERREEEKRDRELWLERRNAQRERQWQLAEKLAERANAMLESPLYIEKETDDGAVKVPARWSFRDVVSLLSFANDLQVAATGSQMEEIKALTVLVRAGWIPESVLDVTTDSYFEMKAAIVGAFERNAQT